MKGMMNVLLITSITAGESLSISLLGFSIVFFVLVVLMAVIRLLRFIMEKLDRPAVAAEAPAAMEEYTAQVPAKSSYGEVKLHDVDEKTAAMLMAIVADTTEIPLNELRFVSIREKADH